MLCLVAIEVTAERWDEGNYEPYNNGVVLEKSNFPVIRLDKRKHDLLILRSA